MYKADQMFYTKSSQKAQNKPTRCVILYYLHVEKHSPVLYSLIEMFTSQSSKLHNKIPLLSNSD